MTSQPPGGDPPDTTLLADPRLVPAAACILVLLAALATLYLGRVFLLPVALAIVGSLLLRPLVRGLERLRVPEAVGAALVVGTLVVLVVASLSLLAGPARDVLRAAPAQLRSIEVKVRELRKPMQDVSDATAQVERLAKGDQPEETHTVIVESDTLSGNVAAATQTFLIQGVVATFLLYFLLSSGQAFLDKLARIAPDRAADKLREVAREIEQGIGRYLLTVTFINAGEGALIGLGAWWIGMPSPLLWGVFAMFVNFIPYLGPIAGCIVMTLAAIATLPADRAVMVFVGYVVISGIEGYLVTPLVVGRRLSLDPVAVFLGVLFWGWLWGVPGTILAVPILAATKIACARFQRLEPVAELLGGHQTPAAAPAA